MVTKAINIKNIKITPILIILLIIAAFVIGMLFTKVNYLEKNTKVVGDTAVQPQAQPTLEQPQPLKAEDFQAMTKNGAAVKGKDDAKVTIVEFSEFECPFCKRYFDESYQQIIKQYGDQIRYVFHDYPLPFHSKAQKLSEAARCAGDQNKYWEMHDLLFKNQEQIVAKTDVTSGLSPYLSQIGLDKNKFNSCLSSGKFTQAIKDDIVLGTKYGVSGTPTFFINGQQLVGAQPFESFKAIIDQELNK